MGDFEVRPKRDGNARDEADSATEHRRAFIQRKLLVGAANDPLESEADAVANEVVRLMATVPQNVGSLVESEPGIGKVRRSTATAPAATTRPSVGSARRVQRSASVLADSFAAPDGVESEIRRTRGAGAPIEPRVRNNMAGAFGADLGAVRIHRDQHADQLNRQLSSKAFTVGNDIYFSKGAYQTETNEGRHLLAHEVTHTIQQSDTAQRQSIQRLTVDNTQFGQTANITVLAAGASGLVAQFSDGGPDTVIVKANQVFGNEMVVGANMHSQMGEGKGETHGFQGAGPSARLATNAEIGLMRLMVATPLLTGPPRNFVAGINANGPVLISKGMAGTTVTAALQGTAAPIGNQLDPNSLANALLATSGPLKVIGRHAYVDVVMGMYDRFLQLVNPENFMYDPATQTFNFVDNVKDSATASFVDKMTAGGQQTGQANFNQWAVLPYVNAASNGTLPTLIAGKLFDPLSGLGVDLPLHSQALFANLVQANHAQLVGHLTKGVAMGRTTMLKMLKKPLDLVAGIPNIHHRRQSMTALLARRYFLYDNDHPGAAWAKATVKAAAKVQ